jgi:drug/metabolite transporter (DMT)-like permease
MARASQTLLRSHVTTSARASALIALHVAVALFGFAGLFGKWLAWPPAAIVFGRAAIAAATLGLIVVLQRAPLRFDRALAFNGAVLAVHWVAFFEAIQLASVAIGLLGYATFPLFVLVLERALLGRRWSITEAVTAAMVTAGLVVLVPGLDVHDRTLQGLAWGVVCGATFAWLAVRSRRFAATHASVDVALWQNAFAALFLLPFVWIARDALPTPAARDVALVLVLGVACTALAHTLFIACLRRLSAHTASVVAALEPVYGIVLALVLLREVPTLRTIAGAVLIVGAAWVATRRAA